MEKNNTINNKNALTVNPNDVLKVTTLIYLKDALIKEAYEVCAELIQTAKSFGAQQREISKVIVEFNVGINGGCKK